MSDRPASPILLPGLNKRSRPKKMGYAISKPSPKYDRPRLSVLNYHWGSKAQPKATANSRNTIPLLAQIGVARHQYVSPGFFEQRGYKNNSVVRKNNVISALLAATNAKMDTESKLPGSKALASVF
jgi:hypothetical protein